MESDESLQYSCLPRPTQSKRVSPFRLDSNLTSCVFTLLQWVLFEFSEIAASFKKQSEPMFSSSKEHSTIIREKRDSLSSTPPTLNLVTTTTCLRHQLSLNSTNINCDEDCIDFLFRRVLCNKTRQALYHRFHP